LRHARFSGFHLPPPSPFQFFIFIVEVGAARTPPWTIVIQDVAFRQSRQTSSASGMSTKPFRRAIALRGELTRHPRPEANSIK
jgi:hypothetical protein